VGEQSLGARPNYFLTNCEQTDKTQRIFLRGGFENMRDPMLAGILSFIIPGVGQLYNGRILAGILWLIFTPGFWIGTGGTLGWICHIIAAYTAYSYAKEHPVRV
jgi:TM2 domain-containing membrane protein YozV